VSRVYFRSQDGDSEVRGWERAWGNKLAYDLAMVGVGVSPGRMYPHSVPSPLLEWLEPKVDGQEGFVLGLSVNAEDYQFVLPDGSRHKASSVLLNTAMALASRPVQFLIRLHVQCELFMWVDGPDRSWLAEVIEEGRHLGVFRPKSGWEEVVSHLKADATEPVVTFDSGSDYFPCPLIAGWQPDTKLDQPDFERWEALPASERWRLGMVGLRAAKGGRQITPKNLGVRGFFGTGLNVFDLNDIMTKQDAGAWPGIPK